MLPDSFSVSCPSVSTASFSPGHSLPALSAPTVMHTCPRWGMALPDSSSAAGIFLSRSSCCMFLARTSPPHSTSTPYPAVR